MTKQIQLEVVTPHGVVFTESVDFFSLRAMQGDIGVLPDHIPIITPIEIGLLEYKKSGEKDYIATMGGFLEVKDNKAVIITESAEKAEDIDILRASSSLKRAESKLQQKELKVDTTRAEAALKRAIIRLKAVELLKDIKRKK